MEPIACSLTADQLPVRLGEIAALGQDALLDADLGASSATLHFTAGQGIRERLQAIVAAESQCCAFLDFHLADDGDRLTLRIDAPAEAQPVLDGLVAAFAR